MGRARSVVSLKKEVVVIGCAYDMNLLSLQRKIVFGLVAIAAVLSATQVLCAAAATSYTFHRNLTLGSRGGDVSALQRMLFDQDYLGSAPTGYFGAKTAVAVAKWQKKVGLVPAVGYFGRKSRAYLASLTVAAPAALATLVVPPAGSPPPQELQVSVFGNSPFAGAFVSNSDVAAARVPVFGLSLSAAATTTIQEIKFGINGMPQNIVAGAYLVQDNEVVQAYSSIHDGVIEFRDLSIQISPGDTPTLWLAIDPAVDLSTGNEVTFSVPSSNDIVAVDASGSAITAAGAFPLVGKPIPITSVSDPLLATFSIEALPIGTEVMAGTLNVLVGSWNVTIGNGAALLERADFSQQGAADASSIKNLRLFINGMEIGTTTSDLDDSGYLDFDWTGGKPVLLRPGPNTIQIFADVMGSPGKDVQFSIFDQHDLLVVDSAYDVPIVTQADPGTDITIPAGTLIMTTH